jgi:hypothetical protein
LIRLTGPSTIRLDNGRILGNEALRSRLKKERPIRAEEIRQEKKMSIDTGMPENLMIIPMKLHRKIARSIRIIARSGVRKIVANSLTFSS